VKLNLFRKLLKVLSVSVPTPVGFVFPRRIRTFEEAYTSWFSAEIHGKMANFAVRCHAGGFVAIKMQFTLGIT
jgi:hypothetical protein